MTLRFPAPVDLEVFLAEYWQRQPLFLGGALREFDPGLTASELAGLACEDGVESRLVRRNEDGDWRVEHGPFDATDFERLPARDWTLLVQDVDKFVPAVGRLIGHFGFLPRWRIDDVMVSYAAPGGTVGPHVDEYDVFLVQGAGNRTWETGRGERHRPGAALRVLSDFVAERRWELSPGDVLYLPPGVAHHGWGEGPTMTFSVGFRSPSKTELILSRAEHQAGGATGRYRDPGLATGEANGGRLSVDAIGRALTLLDEATRETPEDAVFWFGRLVTENKSWLEPDAPEQPLSRDDFDKTARARPLRKDPCVRAAHSTFPGNGLLFVDGASHALAAADETLAASLCLGERIDTASAGANLGLLYRLYCDGKLYFADAE